MSKIMENILEINIKKQHEKMKRRKQGGIKTEENKETRLAFSALQL